MNAYIDPFIYQRSPSGLESASLIGCLARLSGSHALGATTLTSTASTSVNLSKYDQITIFDGANSEVVTVTTTTNQPVTSIPVSALAFAHADSTPWCSNGILGSLADQIISASAWVENITQQSLWQKTYTNETIKIPSLRGAIDNQNQLVFSPRHFPITAENGITIMQNNTNPVTYDATQCIIDQDAQVVSVPYLTTSGSGTSTYSLLPIMTRTSTLYLQITYTAGFAQGALPYDVVEACVSLVSDMLSKRSNPVGAADYQLGPKHIAQNLRGDLSGESNFLKRAKFLLQPYTRTVT